MTLPYVPCGHFALSTLSETCFKDAVFEINVTTNFHKKKQNEKMSNLTPKSKNVSSEIGGKESVSWTQSGNRFRFRFVFVSCVRACVRAKLCGCVRDVLLNAGGSNGKKSFSGGGFTFWALAAIRMGFKVFSQRIILCAWVFWSMLRYPSYIFQVLTGVLFRTNCLCAMRSVIHGTVAGRPKASG